MRGAARCSWTSCRSGRGPLKARCCRPSTERVMVLVGGERELAVTCQFIFASNRSLDELEADGVLLKDLRYRIGDLVIDVPPLAQRGWDVLELAYCFLDLERAASHGTGPAMFDNEALGLLMGFDWPGNVRQLRGVVAYACVHAAGEARILPQHLPPYLTVHRGARPVLDRTSRTALTAWALKRAEGNRRRAAELLGVHPGTIDRRRKRLASHG